MSPLVAPSPSRRFLPLLILLFVGSGCAALIYEIVWFQLLQLVVGSSAVSLGVLLGTFMGGMCIGSLMLPRLVSRRAHPLRVYAAIELGIGLCGILVLLGMPAVGQVYTAFVGYGLSGILLRGVIAGICLLPPTLLMGASLPAIARWVETTPRGVSWMGFFYAGNIAGAVLGCLLAGFYLLRMFDLATATGVAVLLNVAVAAAGVALAARAPREAASSEPEAAETTSGGRGLWPVYVTIALSGMCALAAEVIWTRLLSLMIGASVYTFSIILAVFLIGLGIGSGAGSALARSIQRPRAVLAACQLLLAGAIGWAAYMLANSLPYWPIDPMLSSSPWFNFQLDLARCMWTILPAACLWGASFPLAVAAAAERGQDPGRLIGGIYAANTVGAIVGSIGSGMVLIPWIGTQRAQQVLIALSAVAALVAWGPLVRAAGRPMRWISKTAALAAATAAVAFVVWIIPPVPWMVIAYGRHLVTSASSANALYMAEGMNASIAITQWNDGQRMFHVSGKVEASSEPHDMRLQRMLGHIPALVHPNPRSVLIVGFGAGVTAGSFVSYPGIEKIVICEIEPLIPPTATRYFHKENQEVLSDPRVKVVYDDARHYILTTPEKFDIITSDPIHPWVKGTATLYSTEYFELCKRHLNPGGVITQWVPLYESDSPTVKSEIATFFQVFPNGTVWSNDIDGSGYDTVLLGVNGPMKIDVDALQRRLQSPANFPVAESLGEVGFHSAVDLLATYAGQASDLSAYLRDAQINRDGNLRLQYLAGLGLNNKLGNQIYQEILRSRRFPTGIFVGSDESRLSLMSRFGVIEGPHE
jgi:spermidine synthase